jgi:hypothetical protein
MRLPNSAHLATPWRIHAITPDFRLEDVWALPTPGGPDDFPRLVEQMTTADPATFSSAAVRNLFALRWKLGALLGWEDARGASLQDRVPEDLPPGPPFTALPFSTLYMTKDEFAAEIYNRTVHAVMHLGWIPDDSGHHGQMAVLVKPNGRLGTAYMAAIAPFRHRLVYPPMLSELGRRWARTSSS